MGIPVFYRWLIEHCPRVSVDVAEHDHAPTLETTDPNPYGFEFDNLYLDMNGIIHPCFHPEHSVAPRTYDEVITAVFKYIDRIFSLIRPRKLLFMAVDGVAPRAKMNQQRSRRFQSAKETSDSAAASLRAQRTGGMSAKKGGGKVSKRFDSNVITPGTEFMELLSSALQYYIRLRMNCDPGWLGIKVILSDASVPGEGEHKIMSYIRLQRNLPGFDPNTRHCLYGLDADLIMLALATHEVHFSVLREKLNRHGQSDGKGRLEDVISKQKFQFLHVWVIRDYLVEVLRIPDQTVEVDLERLIDDFIFMCIFVGNDFLPHMPSLEISEGAIHLLLFVYKNEFVRMGGYLTDSSEVNLERVEHFVQTLAAHEAAIFKKRSQSKAQRKDQTRWLNAACKGTSFVTDKVQFDKDGWKERYYAAKFKVQTDADRERVKKHAVSKYVEGICWVMRYYYQGVCSWQWFYPYHYAPFASDFHGLDQFQVNFVLGEPFKPLNQLMAVLPAASAQALPLCYRTLMTDPTSPILDFYPTEFERDMNDKEQTWKAVCRLPFIDECRLLSEIAKVEHNLTDEERRRNTLGLDRLYIHMSYPLAKKVVTFMERNKDNPKLHIAKVKTKIKPEFSGGMNGYVYLSHKPICPKEISSHIRGMKKIRDNEVVCVFYKVPNFHPHIPRPPDGVVTPQESITKGELQPLPDLWHQTPGITEQRPRNVSSNQHFTNTKKRKRNNKVWKKGKSR